MFGNTNNNNNSAHMRDCAVNTRNNCSNNDNNDVSIVQKAKLLRGTSGKKASALYTAPQLSNSMDGVLMVSPVCTQELFFTPSNSSAATSTK